MAVCATADRGRRPVERHACANDRCLTEHRENAARLLRRSGVSRLERWCASRSRGVRALREFRHAIPHARGTCPAEGIRSRRLGDRSHLLSRPRRRGESGLRLSAEPAWPVSESSPDQRRPRVVVLRIVMVVRACVAVLMLGLLAGSPGAAPVQGPPPRVIDITAERFEFWPTEVIVAEGEQVELRLRSEDTMHGFRIVGAGTNVLIPKRGNGYAVLMFTGSQTG